MTVEKMRSALAEAYPGPKWRLACQTMPDRQIIAIYKNLGAKNRLYIRKKRKEPGVKKAVQVTMADLDPSLFRGTILQDGQP